MSKSDTWENGLLDLLFDNIDFTLVGDGGGDCVGVSLSVGVFVGTRGGERNRFPLNHGRLR